MFTFGREKEKQSALYYLSTKDPEKQLVLDMIDTIHDFLENKCSEDALRFAVTQSFTRTAGGGWEQNLALQIEQALSVAGNDVGRNG